MSLLLTPAELVELTEKERPSAQAKELEHMGIPYRPRRDGTLAVLRIHVETIEQTGHQPARLAAEPTLQP